MLQPAHKASRSEPTAALGGAGSSALVGRRYQLLEHIGDGGMGAVYRALDRLSGRRVALKRVSTRRAPSIPDGSTDQRLALAREFQILTSLRHPHILSVLDYGFDQEHQPFLVSELQERAQDFLEAARGVELPAQVELLVQMLQALAYLHRRKIIHCDLKPANILVVGGNVKVLDFGLSVVGRPEGDEPSGGGTPAYLAPEVLRGAAPTPASDLYAVGVMAYELLAGRHPFDTSSRAALLRGVLGRAPDLSALRGGPRLAQVVGQLLAKEPSARYEHATDVIAALSSAMERPLTLETAATRESFLQAAQLVGRQQELAQLQAELMGALQGRGSAWLVGGESGVGKSRLLNEMRTLALVHGTLVLSGHAESKAGGPHRLWREVLRWLSLLVEPSDFEASVLKPVVLDIAPLLGRPVADPPEIDPAAVHARLLEVVSRLLHRLRQPVVMLLEDLQWAQSESLRLLASLVPLASRLPLLILCTYRDDERPNLPAELLGARAMRLGRLSAEAMAELGESMMGAAGRRPEVGALLARETEGNAFFLVEVVRALAEQAGGLEQVGTGPLPERVFTGGVQRAVQRRLGQVPERARPLLWLAAVLGRVLPVEVLQVLAPREDLDQWLLECSEAAVLEPWEQSWRFAHDKLREGLLAQLEPELRRSLHQQVAAALEQVSPEQPAALAFHWSAAGEPSREAHWSLRAAEQSFRNGAYPEARALLERVATLQEQMGAPRLERASAQRKLGEVAMQLNELPMASRHLLAMTELLGQPLPASALGWGLLTLRHLLTQLVQLAWPRLLVARGEQQRR
ncbi:MAG TPA: protein kinase, partial [Myxococcaceae bacterium]|nr:protein kinase [Myxococcaceae bacterium]